MSTRLQAQLKSLVERISAEPDHVTHPVARAWAHAHPGRAVSDITQYCETEEPFEVMADILELVGEWDKATSGKTHRLDALFGQLALRVSLVAVESWLSSHQTRPPAGDDVLSIRMTEEVLAAIVAASWLNCGLRLEFDVHRGAPRVLNLISDHGELQFGHKSATDVLNAELQAHVLAQVLPGKPVPLGAVDPAYLKTQLTRLERRTEARPLIGLGKRSSKDAIDSSVQRRFKDQWGVDIFFFGDQAGVEQDDASTAWSELFETLRAQIHEGVLKAPGFQDTGDSLRDDSSPQKNIARKKIFISYAHQDDDHKKAVLQHLGVLENQGIVELWVDDKIGVGDQWREEIEHALMTSGVALLLISPAFLNSKFILDTEMPAIMKRHREDGMRIVPLLIRPCGWKHVDWLEERQLRPRGGNAVPETGHPRDEALAAIADEIASLLRADRSSQ